MIAQTNQYLECVIETNPDALKVAAALDKERKHGKARGPLHGIPVLVKDVGLGLSRQIETGTEAIPCPC